MVAAAFILSAAVGTFITFNSSESQSAAPSPYTHVALGPKGAEPSIVFIKPGGTVQIDSKDGKSHELSLGKGGEHHEHQGDFYSGVFQADEAWRVRIDKRGTYEFHDHLNPDLFVTVVVYEEEQEKTDHPHEEGHAEDGHAH